MDEPKRDLVDPALEVDSDELDTSAAAPPNSGVPLPAEDPNRGVLSVSALSPEPIGFPLDEREPPAIEKPPKLREESDFSGEALVGS